MRSVACLSLVCLLAGVARADVPSAIGDAPPLTEMLQGPQPEAPPALADSPKVGWAIFGGAATALVPLAISGALFARTFDTTARRDATMGMLTGFTLAPIVSHLIAREWTRAAIFGAVPAVCLVGAAVLLELSPTSDLYGTRQGRLTFGLLLAFSTLSSGVGLADTYAAGRRAEAKRRASLPHHPRAFRHDPRRGPYRWRQLLMRRLLLLFVFGSGCVVVPQNRRGHLADRIMQLDEDSLESYRRTKLYSTREAAAGGDGASAGGGCGCQ